MKHLTFLAVALVLSVGTATPAAADTEKAARTFRTGCINCHQPPDLSFSTDVAWLDQVNRTG